MTEFFRFPHTPHLAWLGDSQPRDDKVLSAEEAEALLSCDVLIEEKIDGANVGLSVGDDGNLQIQNRGSYLSQETVHPQFKSLFRWIAPRRDALLESLFPDLILFGEWCYAVHSVHYTRLPDWFLAFDVYDRAIGKFWSASRRDELVRQLELSLVPRIAEGRFDSPALNKLLGRSRLADSQAEGIYVRRDQGDHLTARAKLVGREFTQAIGEHWSRRIMKTNSIDNGVVAPYVFS